jgi:hypothetical protein
MERSPFACSLNIYGFHHELPHFHEHFAQEKQRPGKNYRDHDDSDACDNEKKSNRVVEYVE